MTIYAALIVEVFENGCTRIGTDGINHPTSFQAVWNYQDGDFVYFDGTISDITYE